MGYYENILNLLSIILILMILFVIVYGCQYKHYNLHNKQRTNYEKFENKEAEIESEHKKEPEHKKETEKNNGQCSVDISAFEKSILDGLSNGSVSTDKLTNLIKEEKFTEKNLENLINYVETFKGMVN